MKRSIYLAAALVCCLLAGIFSFPAAAETGDGAADGPAETDAAAYAVPTVETLRDPDGAVIGISRRGDWHACPENSEAAILAAASTGIGFIGADVSRTADGALVLCEANSAQRMLGTETEAVADYTLEALSALPLKNRGGGPNNVPTAEHILTLQQFLALAFRENFVPVLMLDASLAADAAAAVEAQGAEKTAVLYLTGKAKDVRAAMEACAGRFAVIAEKRGNMLFDILSFLSAAKQSGAAGVTLETTNRYGVNYNQTVLGRFSGTMRAAAKTAESETAGAREDTVKWWDDLISRGYSVIVTDDPQQFTAYLRDGAEARARLQALYGTVGVTWNLPAFKDTVLNDYKKAFTDAYAEAEDLLSDQSASLQALRDCYTALRSAMDEIDRNYEALEAGTAGKAITLPRILLCVAAAAAVIWAQIFFYKKRRKAA